MGYLRFQLSISLAILFLAYAPRSRADFPQQIANDLTNKMKILWQTKGFGAVQQKTTCPQEQVQLKTFVCPSDLFEKVSEPFESRAYGVVKSTIWERCHSEFESRKPDISKNYQEYPTASSLQIAYEGSELSRLGQFTHGVARACTQTKDLNQHVIISRFYSMIGRLNLAASQNSKNLVMLDKILGEDGVTCPDPYFLSQGADACAQQKKCQTRVTPETLSSRAEKDLRLLEQAKSVLKKLPKTCGLDSDCEKIKISYSQITAGLVQRNPWFLDETYMDQSFYDPPRRLKYYFERTKKKLGRYQNEIQNAAKCLQLPGQKNCSMEDMRELLERTPSLQLADYHKFETKKLNSHLRLQECIDEVSMDRDKTGQAVSPLIEFVATLPLAVGATLRAGPAVAKASIPRLSALLGSEVLSNLSSYAQSFKEIQKTCFEKRISLSGKKSASTLENICELDAGFFSDSQFEEGNCLVESGLAAISLVTPAFAAAKLGQALKTAPLETAAIASAERRIGSQVSYNSTLERHAVKEQLLHAQYTTEQQNLKWIETATASKPSVAGTRKFIEIENSQLKFLNDSLKDKDLVTSLTNMHKHLTMEEFEILKKKYPGLKFSPYSDFKSLRFAVDGPIPPGFEKDLNQAFARIQSKYKEWALKNNLVRESDQSETWFKMGTGGLADEASSAARFARGEQTVSLGFNFNSPEVKAALTKQLETTDSKRQQLMKQLGEGPLTQKIDDKISTLKPELFEILRKSTDAKDAAVKIEKRFGLKNFSEDVAGGMLDYARSVDQFSPSLYIGKREVASLDAAQHGGFSIDFVGMGAHNLYGTAAAMAGKSDVNAALVSVRKAEGEVTSLFQERRELVKEVSEGSMGKKLETICSGDDCVGITKAPLTVEDKQRLINNLANRSDGASLRIAFIEAGIENTEARSQIATHGESIEKNLRNQLEGLIEPQRLKGLLFAVDMQSKSIGTGASSLMLGTSGTLKLSDKEKKLINDTFRSAVVEFNKNLVGYPGYKPK